MEGVQFGAGQVEGIIAARALRGVGWEIPTGKLHSVNKVEEPALEALKRWGVQNRSTLLIELVMDKPSAYCCR